MSYSVNLDTRKASIVFRNSHVLNVFCKVTQTDIKKVKELRYSVFDSIGINTFNRMIDNNTDKETLYNSLME